MHNEDQSIQRRGAMRRTVLASCSALAVVAACLAVFSPSGKAGAAEAAWTQDGACRTLKMAAAGGTLPQDPDLAVMRYSGSSNYELAYRGTVLLFDAQYRRTPPERPIGVTPEDMKRVTALYIGHGHADHMSDAPFIAEQAHAPMYGAWPTTAAAKKMGLPDKQNITVKNGDIQKYPGFTVQAVLAAHNSRTREFAEASSKAWEAMKQATGTGPTPEQYAKARADFAANGSRDPHIADQGTIAWFVDFDNGYKIVILDSSGPVTPELRAAVAKAGHIDVALVAYQGYFVAQRQIPATLDLVELFKPDVFMPDHHDETAGSYPDMAGYPLFMAIRDKLPGTHNISPLYQTPICLNTKTKGVYVGETYKWRKNS